MTETAEVNNFEIFQDCLSTTILQRFAPASGKSAKEVKGRKNGIKPVRVVTSSTGDVDGNNDAAELAEFTEYLAEQVFLGLPPELKAISYAAVQDDSDLATRYEVPLDTSLLGSLVNPLPLTIADSLISYGLLRDVTDLEKFLEPALAAYVAAGTAAPPEHTPAVTASRPDGCEICEREQLPLTYHHLIPRAVHAKVIKRGWHKEWELQKVAWLCRACHSFVHKIASNEVLAREFDSVDLLLEREDVQRWAAWVGRVRWKAK